MREAIDPSIHADAQDGSFPMTSCGDVVDTGWNVPLIVIPSPEEISGLPLSTGRKPRVSGSARHRAAHAAPKGRVMRPMVVVFGVALVAIMVTIAFILL
jgi:hypothetical protein